MVRFLLGFLILALAATTDLFAQPSSTACYRDHGKTCREIAYFEQSPWAPCVEAVCHINPELQLLRCTHLEGLVVALEEVEYLHIELAPSGFQGYSNINWEQSENHCGYETLCDCTGLSLGVTCYWGASVRQYKPTEYWTYGAMDCWGSPIVP